MVAALVAAALIVPQQGMAGVRIGMQQRQVVARLGPAGAILHGNGTFGATSTLLYPGLSVVVADGGGVISVSTTWRRNRTAGGVGVGSTEAAVRRELPRARCRTELGNRHCYLGRILPGRIVTDFWLRRGRVWRILIGRVLD